jgi:acyl-CoA synthetase (AMP-forming)/AMP-acid ligase II
MVSTVVDNHPNAGPPRHSGARLRGREISYGTLHARSSQVAQAMRGAGVTAGRRVAFLDKNRPEYFELLFGAATSAGARR